MSVAPAGAGGRPDALPVAVPVAEPVDPVVDPVVPIDTPGELSLALPDAFILPMISTRFPTNRSS